GGEGRAVPGAGGPDGAGVGVDPDRLVVAEVGPRRRRQAAHRPAGQPSVRRDHVRIDGALRRRGDADRPGDAWSLAPVPDLIVLRRAVHEGPLRRGRQLRGRARGLGPRDPPRLRGRGGSRVKYVFILVLLVIGGAGGLLGGAV